MEVKKLYINGEWVASHSDAVIEVESPIYSDRKSVV